MYDAGNFAKLKQRRLIETNRRYRQLAARVSNAWSHSKKVCDCYHSKNDGEHKLIRFQGTDEKFYSCCPIRYYILLGWRAITDGKEMPPEELFWCLVASEPPEESVPSS